MIRTENETRKLIIEIEAYNPNELLIELRKAIIVILQNVKYEDADRLELESSQYFLLLLLRNLINEK
jgi:hypothetical protein